jgi:3-hydroxypropanoate dehydrogenase
MTPDRLDSQAFDVLFREARTHNGWNGEPVSDDTIRELYNLLKWGPTSANCSPARILFVKSKEAKDRLAPHMAKGNLEKTMTAPATAIIAYDLKFYEYMPKLFPVNPKMKDGYVGNEAAAREAAFRNGSLQGGYFILAARALGLDCGPMSGFNATGVKEEFFKGQDVEPNFLCNIGYGDPEKLYPRGPRLSFDEACKIL